MVTSPVRPGRLPGSAPLPSWYYVALVGVLLLLPIALLHFSEVYFWHPDPQDPFFRWLSQGATLLCVGGGMLGFIAAMQWAQQPRPLAGRYWLMLWGLYGFMMALMVAAVAAA